MSVRDRFFVFTAVPTTSPTLILDTIESIKHLPERRMEASLRVIPKDIRSLISKYATWLLAAEERRRFDVRSVVITRTHLRANPLFIEVSYMHTDPRMGLLLMTPAQRVARRREAGHRNDSFGQRMRRFFELTDEQRQQKKDRRRYHALTGEYSHGQKERTPNPYSSFSESEDPDDPYS